MEAVAAVDVMPVRVALQRLEGLDPLDPRAVALLRQIAHTVPTLLSHIEQLTGDRERDRLERAAEKEAERLQRGGLLSFIW